MKPLLVLLMIAGFGLFASALSRPASAIVDWPPLLNCADVNADGAVSTTDVALVVKRFGAAYPSPGYLLLYDVDGGGAISGGDITTVVQGFGQTCPLIETQLAQATLAMTGAYGGPDLRDPEQAFAAGFIQSSQDVPSMGVHLFNESYLTAWGDCCSLGGPDDPGESQLIHPVGLVYTAGAGDEPVELIGAWFIQPNDEVCTYYSIPTPCQSNGEQPIGFGLTNTDDDNQDPPGPNDGWHTHAGLCIWDWGTTDATANEGLSQGDCEGTDGSWFSTYGWMLHVYNFMPNPEGRFMKWNANVP